MLKSLSCCVTLLALAAAGPACARDRAQASAAPAGDRAARPATAGHRLPHRPRRRRAATAGGATHALLSAIQTWLSTEFDLPAVHSLPRIEIVPAAKIAALRYRSLLPDAQTNFVSNDRSMAAVERDTVAVYSDVAQTIYLPEGWTGGTPAELSVLVHEMVHHAQNRLGLKYGCPQEREGLAYLAQERWLGLFGRGLASEFKLDPMTLLVRTKCLH